MTKNTAIISIIFLLILSLSLKAWQGNQSVIIGNEYISSIDAVVAKNDGRIIIGSKDELYTYDSLKIPREFLESWGINIDRSIQKLNEAKAQESLERESEALDRERESKGLKLQFPNLDFPFIATSNFSEMNTRIIEGEKFTIIPFFKEGHSLLSHYRLILEKENGEWVTQTSTTGLDIQNRNRIRINWEFSAEQGIQHEIVGYVYTRTRKVVNYRTRTGKPIFKSEYYYPIRYILEQVDVGKAKDISVAFCTFGGTITKSIVAKGNSNTLCGNTESYPQGDISKTKWLIISSNGSLRSYSF